MAKEFKQWDKAFSKDEIEACRAQWLVEFGNIESDKSWFEDSLTKMGYTAIGIQEARFAVYEADGFRDWQLFRVAMKGLTTKQKIAMLELRWSYAHQFYGGNMLVTEKHRIWNYLGALKRGGQLVEDEFGSLVISR